MAKKQSNIILPLGITAGLFLLLRKKSNVSGIGAMKKQLHILQAINNDYQRIKEQKWNSKEIYDYVLDVFQGYTTPLFMIDEPLLKGSTYGSGEVNKESKALIDFLHFNEKYIVDNAKDYFGEEQPLYNYMLLVYTKAIEDLFEM